MKRIGYMSAFIAFAVFLCACGNRNEQNDWGKTILVGDGAYSDQGVVYMDMGEEQNGILFFFDPESGVYAPLCTKVNCTHTREEGRETECDAFFGSVECYAIEGDHLYYVRDDSYMEKTFCVADTDGTNRRSLFHVENMQFCLYGGYENGYLICPYSNYYDENGNQMDERDPGIWLLNLETENPVHIDMPKAYEGLIGKGMICQGALYYIYSYQTESFRQYTYEELQTPEMKEHMNEARKMELWKYDLATGEKICLWSANGTQVRNARLGYGYLFVEQADGWLRLEDLDSGRVVKMDGTRLEDKNQILFDEGLAIFGDGEFAVWSLDTGEIETIVNYDKDMVLSLNVITKHWVYGNQYNEYGRYVKSFCLPREQFMKGEMEWKETPQM